MLYPLSYGGKKLFATRLFYLWIHIETVRNCAGFSRIGQRLTVGSCQRWPTSRSIAKRAFHGNGRFRTDRRACRDLSC
jgi:hypothetical protein